MRTMDLQAAADHLRTTERGVAAMRHVLQWLDEGGIGLDEEGQAAIATLIEGAWRGYAGTARDIMRAALGEVCEHGINDGEWCEECSQEYKRARRENGDD